MLQCRILHSNKYNNLFLLYYSNIYDFSSMKTFDGLFQSFCGRETIKVGIKRYDTSNCKR